jgi:L-fuconolactonase
MQGIVDAQVHAWRRDDPAHPWDPTYLNSGPVAAATLQRSHAKEMSFDAVLRAMDQVGVDAAIIVTPSLYGYNNSYPLAAAAAHPARFGVVGRLDPAAVDLAEQVRAWRALPGALALRSVVTSDGHREELRSGRLEPLFRAAEEHQVPICAFWPRHLRQLREVVARYGRLQFVVDHLGLPQPPLMKVDDDLFAGLPDLLALAAHPNVAVKVSAAPTLSREPYPFRDIWPHVHRVLAAFGLERAMWGSDFTRVAELHDYRQALGFVMETDELAPGDKEQLLVHTTRKIFRWPRH